ncbi:Endonuclease/exonuclease/phosphatase superfamily [Arabidopsis thaliana x Arabidopsis arenosa]|uniref:Endonuclease/exonuclease/phosphatase superfamily n=1 Tax=Arabidopsis thaliana x Arabidopsis arenosa TaxID=1240361 RepID=A0A8T1ZJ89_9BRAS|nr:Endonuclease/exonuclease/phosphatase superfamily [Arabidopsis thaliana x Arabidopsis arenosa]
MGRTVGPAFYQTFSPTFPPSSPSSPPSLASPELGTSSSPLLPKPVNLKPASTKFKNLRRMERRIPSHLKGKELARGYSPPPCKRIRAPEMDTSDLIEANSLTLIGRLTNPSCQRLWALFPFLANRWNLRGKALGSDLGKGCFQFKFDYAEDMQMVLDNRPYHFDQWMVILQKWEPVISDSFPSLIPFWIELQGLPKHYWKPEMLQTIGEELGEIMGKEITSSSVKLRVLLNGLQPLIKETVVEFPDGKEALVSLEYKNLKNHCLHCHRITHEKKTCPGLQPFEEPPRVSSPRQEPSRSTSKGISRNYYTPQDNFAAPRNLSQGSERKFLPTRAHANHERRHFREETRGSSPSVARSSSQRYRQYRDSPHRQNEPYRRPPSKDLTNSYQTRGEPRHSSLKQNLQWREKTPSIDGHLDCSDSSRSRRPPLERSVGADAFPHTPPPIPTNEEVMGDLREVTLQYINVADPTESAARKRRVFQGEGQNLAETAAKMISAATLANQNFLDSRNEAITEQLDVPQESLSHPPGFPEPSLVPAKKKRGRRLREMHSSVSPDILFRMETKNTNEKVEKALEWMNFSSKFIVSPHSPGGGGLALYWKQEVEISILTSCQNFIDTQIKYAGKLFFATFLYGGPVRNEGTFVDIRSFMAACDLYDLRHSGNFFSWRGQRHEHLVHCRLDRAMSNSAWAEVYPFSHSEYLRFEGSDHRPLLTLLDLTKKKKKGIFRYDRRLKENEEVRNLIHEAWSLDDQEDVNEKITRCRRAIIIWTKEKHQNSQKAIEENRQILEEAMASQNPDTNLILTTNHNLLLAYKAEEDFWKQRSRQLWLASGDKNSGYFHAITRGRTTVNKFSVIEDNDGVPYHEEESILVVITDYFKNLFTSQEGERTNLIQEAIQPRISASINQFLISLPTDEEVQKACFSINADKAPGPDGFSASFFQSHWETVGPQVITEVKSFFTSDNLPAKINLTHIRLIPKIQSPQKLVDYRPIALCTVFYKIIAKLLAKRLQPVLQSLISENQSAFVPKRAITDNVLITHEVLHYLKTSKAKERCYMAVKTDMSKAYDRIEWDFIKLVMERMGFHQKWVHWIMQCVSTVSYSILLNGSAQGSITPQRGIRQGDPLSPYLFILCSEVLSGLCSKAQTDGSLPGIRVALGSPRVNHLLFADDTMFFCRSDEQSCQVLLQILQRYESASGQMINKGKSAITFSAKTPENIKEKAHQTLGMQHVGGLGKYLGLPELFGRKKKDMFNLIIDRIRQRSLSWSSRFLSTAGKATMLKSVLAAMPTYTMSCFKIPGSLCKRIQSALTRFWWDSSADNRKMCWVSWMKLTQAKEAGGLGFRDIPSFNDALLAKVSWRILKNPSCLLAKILLGKYCKSSPFMDCVASGSASHGWKGICIGRDLLKVHLGKAIGSGSNTLLWYEPWISLSKPITPMGPPTEHGQNLKVDHLICPVSKSWISERIKTLLPEYEQEILSLRPSKSRSEDSHLWLLTKNGDYSTKSGYQAASMLKEKLVFQREDSSNFNWFKEIWNIKCAQKIKFFLWKAMNAALPVGELLKSRGINTSTLCPHCQEEESSLHLFFHCPFARKIWESAPFKTPIFPLRIQSLQLGIEMSRLNKRIFDQTQISPFEALSQAISQAREWSEAQTVTISSPKPAAHSLVHVSSADTVTCYTDAAWRGDSNAAGFGWTFRDHLSNSEIHNSFAAPNVNSPLLAEAMALLLAQQQALDLGYKKLLIASDSLMLIKALNSESSSKELYGIQQDILSLALNFDEISFHFVPRELNNRADAIAKSALTAFIVSASGLVCN